MPRYSETTGYIIHTRNFKDTSLIIEFFSKDFGLMSLIAKGIKKNKRLKSQLQYFSMLKVQFFGKSQLKTLSEINIITHLQFENLIEKTSGLYLNELIRYSLVENEVSLPLFKCYSYTLNMLGKQKLTPLLRGFERELLKSIGFELSVNEFDDHNTWLTIDKNSGLVISKNESNRLCLVSDLKLFLSDQILQKNAQKRLNKLMLNAINMSLLNRRIYSRELLKSLLSN